MTGKEQADRTENNAAEQTPGGNGMDYWARCSIHLEIKPLLPQGAYTEN